MQSTFADKQNQPQPIHAAIIMDGNGRWAERQGRPRADGHRAGIVALRRTLKAAPELGIHTLSVFAFSAANWCRPEAEVASLLALLEEYLDRETENLVEDGIRLSIIGRRDRLPPRLVSEIERSEAATQFGDVLHLRVAIDYSARDAIAQATRALIANPDFTKEDFALALAGDGAAEVDLLIRTSGEQRLSDFLLWEIAYAELYFTERAWPDFSEGDLAQAVTVFRSRQRNFGGLPARAA
jgi:undecaprenyl diphosphate synthase